MKIKAVLFTLLTIWMCVSCTVTVSDTAGLFNGLRRLKGNEKMVEKKISLKEYTALRINNIDGAVVNYEQKDGVPYCYIYTDQNLLEALDVKIGNGELVICPKDPAYYFKPSYFVVNTNSRWLEAVHIAGNQVVNLVSPLRTDRISLSISGNGMISGKLPLYAEECRVKVSGSGSIGLAEIVGKTLVGEVTGSGLLRLGGEMARGSLTVTGSGDIEAQDCTLQDADAKVTGSGDISLAAVHSLSAKVTGSGDIFYRGNPSVTVDITGSGDISKMD